MRARAIDPTLPEKRQDKSGQESCPGLSCDLHDHEDRQETQLLSDEAIEKSAAAFDLATGRWLEAAVTASGVPRKDLRGRLRPEPDEAYFSKMCSGNKPSPLRTLWAFKGNADAIRAFCDAMLYDLAPRLECRDKKIPSRQEAHANLVRDMSRGERGRKSVVEYTAKEYGITDAEAEELLFGGPR